MRLGELLHLKKINLERGKTITEETAVDGNVPVIAGGKTSPYSNNKSTHNGNIITISASGAYSGYVWYHDYPIWASDCSVLYSINEDVLTKYLYYALKFQQEKIYKLQHGSGQPHVYPKDIEAVSVPIPSLETQQKIVDEMEQQIAFIKQTESLVAKQEEKVKKVLSKIWQKHSAELHEKETFANKSVFDSIIARASKPLK